MAEGYWELFWHTGLPEVWLIWRRIREPEVQAAFGAAETQENDAPLV